MRMSAEQRIASRWIPEGSTELKAPEAGDLVIYLYESGGRACAIGYSGTRGKEDFHSSYQSEKHRLDRINDLRQSYARAEKAKAEVKTRRSQPHDLEPGVIFCFSWGYEQTNINFYQVVSTTPHTVNVREIAQESVEGGGYGSMSDHRIAVPDKFIGEEIRKKGQFVRPGEPYLSMASYGWCPLWDGKPHYCSWYH